MAPPTKQISSLELDALGTIHNMLTAFKSFDSNSDGFITPDEFKAIIESLGLSFVVADHEPTQMTSVEEFLALMVGELEVGEVVELLLTSFPAIAGKGEEEVSGEVLYEVLSCMGSIVSMEDCVDIIASIDGNGDGFVNIKDFKLLVNALSYV